MQVEQIAGWVTEKKLAAITGLSPNALEHYRRNGDVTDGVEYLSPANSSNGRVMWNVEAYNKWVPSQRRQVRASSATRSVSGSSMKASRSMNSPATGRRLVV